ncbi:hypothetical protein BCV70DRAFT_228493 [Testicularia cyperi]|uniref:Uncharacterized protein n=1 Tax=Testicularia cyperi TaxID=1882483 RepID=A0A317XGY2_9BASI|nr:hypothetical protein BCV70DRAFT_228493 [Testicularia cyperi]
MAGIYRRSLARIGRKESEIAEIRTTPADELSSWLGDDVCTNCGGPAAHGKLFCSDECKLADAREVEQSSLIEGMVSPFKGANEGFAISSANQLDKFRYACPPSPSLLAQMSAPLRATHLTSPALAAYQSSLPAPRGRLSTNSNASTNLRSSSHVKKRSSSQSTFSSISESNASQSAFAGTDPSTPSPAYGPTEDECSDLDAHDFQLPPSVSVASAVMLRKASKSTPSSSSGQSTSQANTSDGRTPKSPLWYARRPSTTNSRGSWFTSPALTATSKVNAVGHDAQVLASSSSFISTGRRSQSRDGHNTLTRRAATDLLSGALRTSPRGGTDPSTTNVGTMARRGNSEDSGMRSPQTHSVASSAGKTMRGASPASCRAFSPLSTDQGCDRCRTLSNISGELDIYANTFVSSNSRGRSSSPHDIDERYRSMKQYHKHSHSAAAGLFFTQLHAQEEATCGNAPAQALGANATAASSPVVVARREHQDAVRSTPPRGRSKARGRSSHRRSPSPPRAAARRDSSQVADRERNASPAPISPRSNPMPIQMARRASRQLSDDDSYHHDGELRSALPQRPSPLALISEKDGATFEPAPVVDGSRGRSRGRSTRAGERASRERSSARRSRSRYIDSNCEISWGGYGHRDSDRGEKVPVGVTYGPVPSRHSPRSRGRARAPEHLDPGFDDVELELDGDDEREESRSHSSSSGSLDSLSARGRALARA